MFYIYVKGDESYEIKSTPWAIHLVKDDSDQLGFKEPTSHYCKELSTFVFWLELAWLGAKRNGKYHLICEYKLYNWLCIS